jgi:hypothetical protein
MGVGLFHAPRFLCPEEIQRQAEYDKQQSAIKKECWWSSSVPVPPPPPPPRTPSLSRLHFHLLVPVTEILSFNS